MELLKQDHIEILAHDIQNRVWYAFLLLQLVTSLLVLLHLNLLLKFFELPRLPRFLSHLDVKSQYSLLTALVLSQNRLVLGNLEYLTDVLESLLHYEVLDVVVKQDLDDVPNLLPFEGKVDLSDKADNLVDDAVNERLALRVLEDIFVEIQDPRH